MGDIQVRYFIRGEAHSRVWQTYDDLEQARRDMRLLHQLSNVTRCQIVETVPYEAVEYDEAQAA